MNKEIGTVRQIFRYPVKSMAGVALAASRLGWDGLEGDRRFAFRRLVDRSGFPFLTASRLPELLLYRPEGQAEHDPMLPTHVRTPDGRTLQINSEELLAEIERQHGGALELMQFKHGIFDESPLSLISLVTILEIERQSGRKLDVRRFRPNIIVDTPGLDPFGEDGWLGKRVSFGSQVDSPAINIALRDKRCVMLNLDPDTAEADATVMKTAIRLNTNHAGVYATVVCTGDLAVGQKVYLS